MTIVWTLVVTISLGAIHDVTSIGPYESWSRCHRAGDYWTADPSGGQLKGVHYQCTPEIRWSSK
jgi:hypothetical protein